MRGRSALTLAELLVTSVVFSLVSGTLMSALFAVPQWACRIADRSDLVREVRIARVALRRDLSGSTSIQWQAGTLVIGTAASPVPVVYAPRLAADGRVVALERVDPTGGRTLIASFLTAFEAIEGPITGYYIQLKFQRGTEWRRLVVMTSPAGGGP